jgi:hypothetical protein
VSNKKSEIFCAFVLVFVKRLITKSTKRVQRFLDKNDNNFMELVLSKYTLLRKFNLPPATPK